MQHKLEFVDMFYETFCYTVLWKHAQQLQNHNMQADRRNTACHTSFHGHAIAEVISHSFLTTYGGVRSQGCPCVIYSRLHLKCDGTCTETRFHLSAKRASPFKSAGASVLSTTGSRGVRISGSNAGYTMFRGSVKSTGYPFHLPVSPSLPLPHVTVCHHISTGLYTKWHWDRFSTKIFVFSSCQSSFHQAPYLCSSVSCHFYIVQTPTLPLNSHTVNFV